MGEWWEYSSLEKVHNGHMFELFYQENQNYQVTQLVLIVEKYFKISHNHIIVLMTNSDTNTKLDISCFYDDWRPEGWPSNKKKCTTRFMLYKGRRGPTIRRKRIICSGERICYGEKGETNPICWIHPIYSFSLKPLEKRKILTIGQTYRRISSDALKEVYKFL